ncbi:hypothetical protein GYH30_024331 [Glycine max]|uniref:Uncharacterized protein n=2 Tax=Glycine subgen. Soja TaxID=1462606 RepID=K7LCB1_SOYBN|nr:hypothetical protein GYH30_024331 [Glycine max]KHN47618.1 Vacuolar protein sorting-associated protein 35B [Glycine soja]RZB91055.1 Vacuolar protein sorting-associated protein 35B [Glycine soja]
MYHLDHEANKVMAMVIIQSITKNNTCISTFDKVAVLFELIKGLIMDLDGTTLDDVDEEDFNEEQNCVARLIRMLHNDEPEEMFKITIIMFILIRQLQGQDGNIVGEEAPTTPKTIF